MELEHDCERKLLFERTTFGNSKTEIVMKGVPPMLDPIFVEAVVEGKHGCEGNSRD